MKGEMSDVTGRVWTWLVQQEGPRAISEIMIGINHCVFRDVEIALKFWTDAGEISCNDTHGPWMYQVINAKDPGDE